MYNNIERMSNEFDIKYQNLIFNSIQSLNNLKLL